RNPTITISANFRLQGLFADRARFLRGEGSGPDERGGGDDTGLGIGRDAEAGGGLGAGGARGGRASGLRAGGRPAASKQLPESVHAGGSGGEPPAAPARDGGLRPRARR